ncbi:MAG: cation:proton antiporter, partial [Saprospiraceae bacterium]
MQTFQLISILMVLCAALAYLNHRFLRLPSVIGLLILSLIFSSVIWILSHIFFLYQAKAFEFALDQLDFSKAVFEVMLSFMLFAGSFHADTASIRREARSITILALAGTVLTTLAVAALLYVGSRWLQMPLEWIYCLLFGALIAPTDPIAVLGILNRTKVPDRIKAHIVGESLFNDGVGIVIFLTILEIVEKGVASFTFSDMLLLFGQEAFGGLLLGAALGFGN